MKKPSPVALGPRLSGLFAIVLLGGITPFLDTTIVNVSLHSMAGELSATTSVIQWVSTAYLLALMMTVPITAWATRRFGAKTIWLAGLAVFGASSIACSLAPNLVLLVLSRVLQGVGAGLVQPTMVNILLTQADKDQRAGVFIATSNVAVVVPIFGPTVGGFVVGTLGWRWIFLINIPLCLAAMVLAQWKIPKAKNDAPSSLDWVGLVLLASALGLIIYSLSQMGSQRRFSLGELALLSGGLILLAGFISWGLRKKRRAIMDLALFKTQSFKVGALLRFLSGFAIFGGTFLIPLFIQQVGGLPAETVGMLLAIQGLGVVAIRWIGRPMERLGSRRSVILGFWLVILATAGLSLGSHFPGLPMIALILFVRGTGLGVINVSISVLAYDEIETADIPNANSAIRILQQLGGSFGVAVLALIIDAQGLPNLSTYHFAFWSSIAIVAVALAFTRYLPKGGMATLPLADAGSRT